MTEKTEKANEKMPTRGIRMPDELWNTCVEMSEELGYGYPSDFIRDAIEFFIEWNKRKSSEKFLTPALESVMRGIVKDSEDRQSTLLFKLAVELDVLARVICHDHSYSAEGWETIRKDSIRRVMDTNGRLHLGEKGTEWQDLY